MMLLDLPPELVSAVLEYITSLGDWAALAGASRLFYQLANPRLYKLMARSRGKRGLFWGAATGQAGTVRLSLEAGAEPFCCWPSQADRPRPPYHQRHPESPLECCRITHWDRDRDRERGRAAPPRGKEASMVRIPLEGLSLQELDSDEGRGDNPCGGFYSDNKAVWMPIHLAAFGGHCQVLRLLLGAESRRGELLDPRVDAPVQNPNVHHPYKYNYPLTLGRYPFADPPNVNPTPLLLALSHKKSDAALYLLSQGAMPFFFDPLMGDNGPTALHVACQWGLMDVLAAIVDKGYQDDDIDEVDDYGQTPLLLAMACRNWDCASWLVRHGADVHCRIEQSQYPVFHTALIWAIVRTRDNVEMVREMLHQQPFDRERIASGAPLRQTLMAAARTGNIRALETMVASGGVIPAAIRKHANEMLWALLDQLRRDEIPDALYLDTFCTVKHVDEAIDTMSLLLNHGATWTAKVPAKKFMGNGQGGRTALEKLKFVMTPNPNAGLDFGGEKLNGIASCIASRISFDSAQGSMVTILPTRHAGYESLEESASLHDIGFGNMQRGPR